MLVLQAKWAEVRGVCYQNWQSRTTLFLFSRNLCDATCTTISPQATALPNQTGRSVREAARTRWSGPAKRRRQTDERTVKTVFVGPGSLPISTSSCYHGYWLAEGFLVYNTADPESSIQQKLLASLEGSGFGDIEVSSFFCNSKAKQPYHYTYALYAFIP